MVKNSENKENFIVKLIVTIKRLETENITSKESLKQIIQALANNMDRIWFKYLKVVNITKHSKTWWNDNCHRNLRYTEPQNRLKIKRTSKALSKKLNVSSSTKKFKKLQIRIADLGKS